MGGGGGMGGDGGSEGGRGFVGGEGGNGRGDGGGEGGVNAQMHCCDEVHGSELSKKRKPPKKEVLKTQPGGEDEPEPPEFSAVWLDRSSAVAAASQSLLLEMRAPPQEPLSIM